MLFQFNSIQFKWDIVGVPQNKAFLWPSKSCCSLFHKLMQKKCSNSHKFPPLFTKAECAVCLRFMSRDNYTSQVCMYTELLTKWHVRVCVCAVLPHAERSHWWHRLFPGRSAKSRRQALDQQLATGITSARTTSHILSKIEFAPCRRLPISGTAATSGCPRGDWT